MNVYTCAGVRVEARGHLFACYLFICYFILAPVSLNWTIELAYNLCVVFQIPCFASENEHK